MGLLLNLPLCPARAADAKPSYARWEDEIKAFEAQDRATPPPANPILFVGSTTVHAWKTLAEDFPDCVVLNRGFGGAEIADVSHFADRIIFPYKPRAIFFRVGGNDIANGRSVPDLFADFKAFVATVRTKLPDVNIYFIAWNPTPARWSQWSSEKQYNDMVKEYANQVPHVKYIETADIVLGADGKPRPELFLSDGLYFNAEGFKLLTARLRPFLPRDY